MIAVLKLQFDGKEVHASLHENGRWACTNPELLLELSATCDPLETIGPQYGEFGAAQVQKAIETWKGKVLFTKPRSDVDRVY